ncbi:hypothetical protein MHBO_003715 [Bonamia ostreae]|uniref:Uncharacterized protein n=1 Tax=Bonamia ostreae TaxID=126728 RepID=A0ABV2ARC3_9EUKA
MKLLNLYIKYAIAVYGIFAILLDTSKTVPFVCPCIPPKIKEDVIDSSSHNYASIKIFLDISGIDKDDLLLYSFNSNLESCNFAVVLDRANKTVIVAIQGTTSLRDFLTDLNVNKEVIDPGLALGYSGIHYAHKGILRAGNWILGRLTNSETVVREMESNKIVTIGHSLGF